MSTFLLIALSLLLVAVFAGGYLWHDQGAVDITAPEEIAKICAYCGAHYGGPSPDGRRLVSHGACAKCYAEQMAALDDTEKPLISTHQR